MTFDEYADQRGIAGLEEEMCKDFWNAAIEAAIKHIKEDQYYIAICDVGYDESNPAEKLRKLLTAS